MFQTHFSHHNETLYLTYEELKLFFCFFDCFFYNLLSLLYLTYEELKLSLDTVLVTSLLSLYLTYEELKQYTYYVNPLLHLELYLTYEELKPIIIAVIVSVFVFVAMLYLTYEELKLKFALT